jgi:hypothetical protein
MMEMLSPTVGSVFDSLRARRMSAVARSFREIRKESFQWSVEMKFADPSINYVTTAPGSAGVGVAFKGSKQRPARYV